MYTSFQCYNVRAQTTSFDHLLTCHLCDLAYVNKERMSDFFMVLTFSHERWIYLTSEQGVSRSHSVRDKLTILNVYRYIFHILKAIAAQFYWKSH